MFYHEETLFKMCYLKLKLKLKGKGKGKGKGGK